ncbi:dihydroxyacetone phosphate acyltransferase [Megalops cyprinoides]|uniref:dihydroxyacetone phosphate acyltransferase n=1 Tax=Megalops cyprinoides TaxID=118141 RepID=UPI0018647296|nr:dihydroxyacetone phosphate acyltransferase [Megalops cyprinoides]
MENSVQFMELNGWEHFRDILEERRRSSDLSHALRSFNPQPYKGMQPRSSSALNRTVLESQYLRYVIQQMSAENGEPSEVIREEAAGILEEMSQNLQLGFIRFLGFTLSKVFKRLFRRIHVNDEGLQRLQQAIQEYPVVLMPNHRSYVDFLVLSYILFTYDISIPVIAAGIPLMGMKLVGEIFRRSGAFFIRRAIGADKLYWAVLSEYVRTIVRTGYAPIEFYVEGLRSRSLKSLTPKLGMMHMVIEPFFKGEVYDISLVPISISYDRVLEESLLAHELLGVPKPKESTMGLLKARKVLNEDYGTMHVCFGHPVSVRELAKGKIDRRQYNLVPRDLPVRPSEDCQAFVNTTAHTIVHLQEENMVLSPWSLMATILMQNLEGMDWDSLARQTQWLKELALGFGAHLDWPGHMPCSEVMSSSLSLHRSVARCEAGRVLLVEEEPQGTGSPEEGVFRKAVTVLMCASYRNQALHVFVRPAVLAVAMRTAASSRREDIFTCFRFLQEVFSNEFIFIPGRGGEDFEEACSLLKKCGAVQIMDQDITVMEGGHSTMAFLRAILEPYVEAYQVVFRYLCDESSPVFTEKEFVPAVRSHALKLMLSGALESYDVLSSDTQKNVLTALLRLDAVTKSRRAEKMEFRVNKAVINRIGDTLAGRITPPTASHSRL